MRGLIFAALVSTAILARTADSNAAVGNTPAEEQAAVLFNVGAQAYEKGDYAAAVQAFEQAYSAVARPGILFSKAQAHRKQYYATGGVTELRAAMKDYRAYLERVKEGGRRPDAAEALVKLEEEAAKVDPNAPTKSSEPTKAETRLMVSSPTADARIAVDDGLPVEAPMITPIKPGKHLLHVAAKGYFEERRAIDVAEGAVAALDIALHEKPGRLLVKSQAEAQVWVDGVLYATTPLPGPIALPGGRHVVSVVKNGRRGFQREVELVRDEETVLDAQLRSTNQRTTAYALLGLGVGSVVAGGVFSAIATHDQQSALSARTTLGTSTSGCAIVDAQAGCPLYQNYTSGRTDRDTYRVAAGVAFGGGLVLAATSVLLYSLDLPSVEAAPLLRPDSGPRTPSGVRPELGAAPLVLPGVYGASLVGRF